MVEDFLLDFRKQRSLSPVIGRILSATSFTLKPLLSPSICSSCTSCFPEPFKAANISLAFTDYLSTNLHIWREGELRLVWHLTNSTQCLRHRVHQKSYNVSFTQLKLEQTLHTASIKSANTSNFELVQGVERGNSSNKTLKQINRLVYLRILDLQAKAADR